MSLHDFLYNPPPLLVVLTLVFVFCQGIWIFRDAQTRGRFPWLWGIWGISSFPVPLLVYYFTVIRKDREEGKNA